MSRDTKELHIEVAMGIDKDKSQLKATTELRHRAEEQLEKNTVTAHPQGAVEDPLKLHHELQVHQIELEMQNAELRQARDDEASALEEFTDLYDFAPVGYFTLDRKGDIRRVNLTGAALVGIERSRLNGRRFEHFVAVEARSAFAGFLEKVFTSQAKETCEVALLKEGNSRLFVRIEAVGTASGQECRIALIDITERKRTEEALLNVVKAAEVALQKVEEAAAEALRKVVVEAAPGVVNREVEAAAEIARQKVEAAAATPQEEKAAPEIVRLKVEAAAEVARQKIEAAAEVASLLVKEAADERKRAMEALLESEERFRLLIDGAKNYAIIMLDADGHVASWNDGAKRLKGWDEKEVLGQHFSMFYPEDAVVDGHPKNELEIAVAEGRYAEEGWRVRKDGSKFMADMVITAIHDESGKLRGFSKITRDITEHKQAEEAIKELNDTLEKRIAERTAYITSVNEALRIEITERKRTEEELRENELRYRTLFNNKSSGMCHGQILLDESGQPVDYRFIDVNDTFCAMTGLETDAVLGRTAREVMPGIENAAFDFIGVHGKVALTGEEAQFETYQEQLRRWFSVFLFSPAKEYFVSIFHDITERKRAEEALRESEGHLRLVLQASSMGTFEVDLMTGAGRWNATEFELLGLKPGDVSPSPETFFRYVHPEDIGLLQAQWEEALLVGKLDSEFRIVRSDGEVRWLAGKGEFVFESKIGAGTPEARGRARSFMGVNFDITERKKAEEELSADLTALTRMHALSTKNLETGSLEPMLQEIMEAAVVIVGAEKGTLQLVEGETLSIVAHHGHKDFFLDFFAFAESRASVCGEAMKQGGRVIVEDIESSALFAGTPSLDILRDSGVRSVQSTPLLNRKGELLGILTTQWGVPYVPDEHDLWRIDLLVRFAADLIEHKKAEEAIKASLHEKEVMLKEIHHRVKNNLQVISSLISLQASGSKDETVREVLKDVTYRVRSMALVHEKLYQSTDLARINFAEYTRSLLNYLWRAHGATAANVRLTLDMEPMPLPVDTAIPCGLILNELAGNALKHAFRGRNEGEVTVLLHGTEDGRICLSVRDNGVGLPEGLDWRQVPSLGLRLLQMLSKQLGAAVDVRSEQGTAFEITFKVKE